MRLRPWLRDAITDDRLWVWAVANTIKFYLELVYAVVLVAPVFIVTYVFITITPFRIPFAQAMPLVLWGIFTARTWRFFANCRLSRVPGQ